MIPQRFESRRQVVEAVRLTADADWEAIAKWCGGEVVPEVHDAEVRQDACIDVLNDESVYEGDWIIRFDADTFTSETRQRFPERFQPVTVSDDIASEIRQALEGATPEGVEVAAILVETIFGPSAEIEMSDADRALIAAAPELLERAADRIEALEHALTVVTHHVAMTPHVAAVDEAVAEFIAKEGA